MDVPPEQAWEVLTDVPRIAPCLPGAQLKEVVGEEYKGVVKVKVGPITAQYSGVARFTEKDPVARRAVLSAEGRDTRGAGNARATITASLAPDGDGTAVEVVTDLDITGRVAQFGRSILGDVSAKLMEEFASCLSAQLADTPSGRESGQGVAQSPPTEAGPAAEDPSGRESGQGVAQSTPAEDGPGEERVVAPLDLGKVVGGAISRRLVPALGGGVLALFLLWRNRRRRRRRK